MKKDITNKQILEVHEFCKKVGITEKQFHGEEKVGDSLYLGRLTSVPAGFSPTVVGSLYLDGLTSNKTTISRFDVELKLQWCVGLFRIFDGMFCEVLSKKRNIFKVKVGENIQYVVQHNNCFSHGDTIKQASESLLYKISDRDTSQYSGLTFESTITKEEAIKLYRAVTGACESGTRMFVESLTTTKKKCTVNELINLTKGQYGNGELISFFSKKG